MTKKIMPVTPEFIMTMAKQMEAEQRGTGYKFLAETMPTITGQTITDILNGKVELYAKKGDENHFYTRRAK